MMLQIGNGMVAKWLKILDQVMEGCDGECFDRDHCDHER